ncbi:hypothetical protein MRX96_025607 [Rhipicephalus microplus]
MLPALTSGVAGITGAVSGAGTSTFSGTSSGATGIRAAVTDATTSTVTSPVAVLDQFPVLDQVCSVYRRMALLALLKPALALEKVCLLYHLGELLAFPAA